MKTIKVREDRDARNIRTGSEIINEGGELFHLEFLNQINPSRQVSHNVLLETLTATL